MRRRAPELSPVLARRETGMTLKQAAKERGVAVSDGRGDFLNTRPRVLEMGPRRVNAKPLQVLDRRDSRGFLETANEVPRAHADAPCERIEARRLTRVVENPLLRAHHRRITVATADR